MAADKTRYWCAVLYPENMVDGWEIDIGDIVQVPYAYCVHDADFDLNADERKVHVHLILAFPNTTTKKHAFDVVSELFAPGRVACNTIKPIINIRNMYDYLIHDTDTCRKKNKKLYSPACRITGNNFDIGAFEQLSITEKNDMCKELCEIIRNQGFINFGDFYAYVIDNMEDSNYFEIIKSYSGLFERLTKANFQKFTKHRQENFCYVNPETGEIASN